METDITNEDIAQTLQRALEEANQKSNTEIDYSYGFSMSEIAEMRNLSSGRARRLVKLAIAEGRVECTGRQMRPNIASEKNAVPVYRVKRS